MDEQRQDIFISGPHMKLKRNARIIYDIMFALTLVLAVLSLLSGDAENLILTIPIVIIMGMAVFTDRDYVHIPPLLIVMMIGTFYLSVIGRLFSDSLVLEIVSMILTGINFGLLGLIMVFLLLKSVPGSEDVNDRLVLLFVMSLPLSLFSLMCMLQFGLSAFWSGAAKMTVDDMMLDAAMILIGTAVVCIIYATDSRHHLMRYTLVSFLEENAEYLGIQDRERDQTLRLIAKGESETLEFKSTLRTNLETGETDKRMEKAVLKTLVAFMNTDGGTLLIGVSDDGSVCGVDLQSFENKDKLNLHLTNLISSQIGNGFLPYISFDMVDFDDKSVVRVRCLVSPKPVFLKDGKTEMYFVRSGPSSVELTGMSLINYVNNRNDEMVRKASIFD